MAVGQFGMTPTRDSALASPRPEDQTAGATARTVPRPGTGNGVPMQAKRIRHAPRDPERTERAVLALAVASHPHHRTMLEMSRDQSQEETAVRASVHRTEISHLERGLRVARVDTFAKLAAALEVDPGDFFEGIKWSRETFATASSSPTTPLRSEHGQAVQKARRSQPSCRRHR